MSDLKEKKEIQRKTLAQLFIEPCTLKLDRALMHQAFQIPGGSTESTISSGRRATPGMEIVYHPGYGLIGKFKGSYFLAPAANVIVGHE